MKNFTNPQVTGDGDKVGLWTAVMAKILGETKMTQKPE